MSAFDSIRRALVSLATLHWLLVPAGASALEPGNLLVPVCCTSKAILELDTDTGTLETFVDFEDPRFTEDIRPVDLALEPSGDIFVATDFDTIYRVARDGSTAQLVSDDPGLNNLSGIAVNGGRLFAMRNPFPTLSDDVVFEVDLATGDLDLIAERGAFAAQTGIGLGTPADMEAVDGAVLFADVFRDLIFEVPWSGSGITGYPVFASSPTTGALNGILGIDPAAGVVYAAHADAVSRVDRDDGDIVTIAANTAFGNLSDVEFDAVDQRLFVWDTIAAIKDVVELDPVTGAELQRFDLSGLVARARIELVPHGSCGNGVLEFGELCDDGNTTGGDCCTPSCVFPDVESTPCCSAGACQIGLQCGVVCFTPGGVCSQPGGPGTACNCVLP